LNPIGYGETYVCAQTGLPNSTAPINSSFFITSPLRRFYASRIITISNGGSFNKGESMTIKKQALLVTTEHRGVFFGYGIKNNKSEIELEKVRMCVYWSSDMRGVMGLAVTGPSSTCRISQAVKKVLLRDVTAIMEVAPEAVKAWEKAPWA